MSVFYEITINNWFEHNPKSKKGYTHFMVSKRIFNDDKIAKLKPIEFQLYMYYLSICADLVSNQFTISAQMMPKYMRISAKSLRNCLERLQEFQLLSYAENGSLYKKNRIEKNRIEKNSDEKIKNQAVAKTQPPPVEEKTSNLISFYCDQWKYVYGASTNPIISKKDSGILKNTMRSVGYEKTKLLIENYLKIPDPWFLKKRHDLATMFLNLNSIVHFIDTGNILTSKDYKQIEKNIEIEKTMKKLDEAIGTNEPELLNDSTRI